MKIKISIAQINVEQSLPEANLQRGEAMIAEGARRKSNIICFPEMWTTGFNYARNESLARGHEKIIDRIAELAKRYKIWINGSTLALDEDLKISNTSILFDPEGKRAGIYRKIHLFGAIGEDRHVAPGKSLCTVGTPWGLSALAICYDIRFPELFRAYALKGARIVFLSSAFPHPKLDHWKVLLRARAIENQMYVVGANRVGSEDIEGSGEVRYCGDSAIIDPWGRTVLEGSETDEDLLTADIDMDMVDTIRSDMRVLKDRRPELYA